MSHSTTLAGPRIFDGKRFHDNSALIISDGLVKEIVSEKTVGSSTQELDGGYLLPGFIDLQVNGGGGCLFNDDPCLDAIVTLCAAHSRLGTVASMPTLITDTSEKTKEAIEAAVAAQESKVPGFLGLHLEGPHLSVARKGAHDPNLIRFMNDADLEILLVAAARLNNLMITVAPESVSLKQIKVLRNAGAIISLGHTNASYEDALSAARAGATCATHLYNAMSPLSHREPGLVGAVLQSGELSCGLIADGHHVHPAAIQTALDAKRGPGRIFLVSDSMSVTGTDAHSFTLNGRTILRQNGCLTLEDGTLAGADLDMASAVRYMVTAIGTELETVSRMASLYPARVMGCSGLHGHLEPGAIADMIHLDGNLRVQQVWQSGKPVL